jgi:hypothetical protein
VEQRRIEGDAMKIFEAAIALAFVVLGNAVAIPFEAFAQDRND